MTTQETKPQRGRPRTGPDPVRFKEILDAAARRFLANGYDATSIQDIADEVGILKGSLYYYVKTKEDFLFEIIKRAYDDAMLLVEPVVNSDQGALAKLNEYVDKHVRFSVENLTSVTIQVREFRSLSPERKQLITAGGDSYINALRKILLDGQNEGSIDPDLDVRIASLGILGLLNSVTTWYNPEGRLSTKRLSDHFAGLVLASVVSDATVAEYGSLSAVRASAK